MSSITATTATEMANTTSSMKDLNIQSQSIASKAPIEELAEQISANATVLSDYLRSNGHAQPSFKRDTPVTTLPSTAPQNIRIARQKLMEAALRTFQLAVGPSEYLPNLAVGYQYLACLRWLTHFDIFSLVPLHDSISYVTLAASANVSESQLTSIARMAMTSNLFCEPTTGHVAHTATSALLITNPNFHDWALFMTNSSTVAASKLVEASHKWPRSIEKNQTAYNIAFETELPFFEHLATLPEKTKQFAGYMKNVTSSEGTSIEHLLSGFAWGSLGKATVVDIGGSTGNTSIALAKAFPGLNFIVQDLPENAEAGQASLSTLPIAISSRIFFQGNDFFMSQPFNGAQIYLLRMILHDWPAREATTILKNIVQALTPNSKILIMDSVLPTPGSVPSVQERLLRVRDLTMMQSFNSRERNLSDWKDLLTAADERLRLSNVVQPFGSMMSVMEVTFQG